MMQRYEPIRGMYICVEGGSYVLYSDHLAVVAEKNKEYQTLLSHHEEQMGDSMGKITCLKTTLAEKDAEIAALQAKIIELQDMGIFALYRKDYVECLVERVKELEEELTNFGPDAN